MPWHDKPDVRGIVMYYNLDGQHWTGQEGSHIDYGIHTVLAI